MTAFLLNDYVYAQWLCFQTMTAYLVNDFLLVNCVSAVIAFLLVDFVSTLFFHSMTAFPLWLRFHYDCVSTLTVFPVRLCLCSMTTFLRVSAQRLRFHCIPTQRLCFRSITSLHCYLSMHRWCNLLCSSSKPLVEIASKPGLFDWFSHQAPSTRGQHFVYDDFSRWSVLVNRRWRWSRGRLAHLRS